MELLSRFLDTQYEIRLNVYWGGFICFGWQRQLLEGSGKTDKLVRGELGQIVRRFLQV